MASKQEPFPKPDFYLVAARCDNGHWGHFKMPLHRRNRGGAVLGIQDKVIGCTTCGQPWRYVEDRSYTSDEAYVRWKEWQWLDRRVRSAKREVAKAEQAAEAARRKLEAFVANPVVTLYPKNALFREDGGPTPIYDALGDTIDLSGDGKEEG